MTRVRVFRDPDELGQALAAEILAAYGRTKGDFLLGSPGGRSVRATYRALAGRYDAEWPAGIVHEHADAVSWLDAEATP